MMIDSFYLAWRYVRFYRIRSVILLACITLIAGLPLALDTVLTETQRQLLARAESTPLIAGAKGSALDLVMSTLYFSQQTPQAISMASALKLRDTGLAAPIPLFLGFQARGFPIVGTSLDYFGFRKLQIRQGRLIAFLGDCMLGAEAAKALGVNIGEFVVSDPEQIFDIAGAYPLKMKVVGILAPAHSADDFAVFADVKTAWVIAGIGHGHGDLRQMRDPSLIIEQKGNVSIASAKLKQYNEISPANMASFHFHGSPETYPLTGVIAVSQDAKSQAILRGRIQGGDTVEQLVDPSEIVDELLKTIFRIKQVLDAAIGIVGFATILAVVLVFALSLRLREREIDTMFKLGCRRGTIARLLAAELGIIVGVSSLLTLSSLLLLQRFANPLVRLLLLQ